MWCNGWNYLDALVPCAVVLVNMIFCEVTCMMARRRARQSALCKHLNSHKQAVLFASLLPIGLSVGFTVD